jgi:hypothetical protein
MGPYISDVLGCKPEQLTPYFKQIDDAEREAQRVGKLDTRSVADRLSFAISRLDEVIYMYDYCPNSDLHRIREVFQTRLQEILATA